MMQRKSKGNGALPVLMTNLGATFKQARESRGISLDQIANETRISTRFLAAIENEEFHLLPGGVFNRGFVRAYAEKIGIDPDQAVAEYQRIAEVRQPEILSSPAPAATARKGRSLYPVALGALFLLIVIFYVATREAGHTAQTASAPAKPAAANVQAAAPVIPPPGPVTPPAAAPETTDTAAAADPAPQQAPPTPQTAAQTTLKLELEATEKTWVKVTTDGTTVDPGEVLEAGTMRKFTAQNTIRISVGNAAGVSLKLNDKPMKPLGKSGQVREVTITPDTAKDFTD